MLLERKDSVNLKTLVQKIEEGSKFSIRSLKYPDWILSLAKKAVALLPDFFSTKSQKEFKVAISKALKWAASSTNIRFLSLKFSLNLNF
jgi:hypothetical protein